MSSSRTVTPSVPPLRDGDRLTAEEFERRYHAMPHVKKAELIEGVVYMPSPVRARNHASPHARLIGWLIVYEAATPGTLVLDNGTVRLGGASVPQPDATLFVAVPGLGPARLTDDDYLEGAPEFVAEVSASSDRLDLGDKFRAYQGVGVREYLVWRSETAQVEWFVLRGGRYEPLAPVDGVLRSEAFLGLWLDAAALVAGDLARVLAALQRGVATPEHAAFVRRLGGEA